MTSEMIERRSPWTLRQICAWVDVCYDKAKKEKPTVAESMIERVALAMKNRAAETVGNLSSLEPVLVGSLGDAWKVLASAALAEIREPTGDMVVAAVEAECRRPLPSSGEHFWTPADTWKDMIDEALK